MNNDKVAGALRLGVAGLGMAGTQMIRGIRDHPDIDIRAAADRHEQLLAEFRRDFQARCYDSVEEMCADDGLDAIYIATPHQFHAAHAICAAESGKHIIVEKPLALTLADCDAIIQAVERAGVQLVVGHTHSFDPAVALMRDIIAEGTLGPLVMINTWNYTNFLYRPRRPEELDTAQGGGILFNQVPHQIDTLRYLAGGALKSVRAAVSAHDPARPTEGACNAFLQFESGAAATLAYSGYDFFDTDEWHFSIGEGGQEKAARSHGQARRRLGTLEAEEEARLRTENFGYKSGASSMPAHQPHFGVLLVSCTQGDMRPSPGGVYIYGVDGMREVLAPPRRGEPGRGLVVDELVAAVRQQKPAIHNARWGKATLEVALAFLESARSRREITLSFQTP